LSPINNSFFYQYSLMNIRIYFFIYCIIAITPGNSQDRYDQQWILRGTLRLDFNDNQLNIEAIPPFPGKIYPGEQATTMNSEVGELLFYSGGCEIINADHLLMTNGDSLNPGARELGYCKSGSLPWDQGLAMIPFPGHHNQFLTFTLDVRAPFELEDTIHFPVVPLHVYAHLINMEADSTTLEVLEKNVPVLSDTIARGYLQITRHGNGRDWWLIVPEWNSNCYYTLLITPSGIDSIGKSCLGFNYGDKDLAGMAHVSPNGEKYARCSGQDNRGIQVIDFDRCSGTFSNYSSLTIPEPEMYFTGLGFSPDSRILYVTTRLHAWQFDLTEPDIQASLELNGELLPEEITPQKGTLYHQEIGPDGRIYIASPGSHAYLSTINKPNKKGLACDFRAYNIPFPEMLTNYRALPNNVFFRLGPYDGSLCDTLGLNNFPVAKFRDEQYTLEPSKFEFTDLSYHNPEEYNWDFGDGHFTNEQNLVHIYENPGLYQVCLTVSNNYGSDNYCDTLVYVPTDTKVIQDSPYIYLRPNPANDVLRIEPYSTCLRSKIILYNSTGVPILYQESSDLVFDVNVSALPSGFYLIKFICDNMDTVVERISIAH
jgi:hypothetical protein